jgi:hypothetical protein
MATARGLSRLGTREFAAAVCEMLGRRSLHPSTVSKWEHCVVTPPADVLLAAARIARVPIQLLFDDGISGPEPANRLRRLENQVNDLTAWVERLAAADGHQDSTERDFSSV